MGNAEYMGEQAARESRTVGPRLSRADSQDERPMRAVVSDEKQLLKDSMMTRPSKIRVRDDARKRTSTVVEEHDGKVERPRRSEAEMSEVEAEQVAPVCIYCDRNMVWSDYAMGAYQD